MLDSARAVPNLLVLLMEELGEHPQWWNLHVQTLVAIPPQLCHPEPSCREVIQKV